MPTPDLSFKDDAVHGFDYAIGQRRAALALRQVALQ